MKKISKLIMKKIITLVCITLALVSLNAVATEQFLYAGFAYSGNFSNRDSLYPYTSKLDVAKLDQEFLKRLQNSPEVFKRLTVEQRKLGQGNQISVAFALNGENAEYQVINGESFLVLRIFATVLAFDRNSKNLVGAYPFGVGTTVKVNGRPSAASRNEMIAKLYFTNEYGVNAFDKWIAQFKNSVITEKFPKYFQVKNVDIEAEAGNTLTLYKINEGAFKNQIGNMLDAALSSENNIPILPSALGEAIGGKMAYRFSNAAALELKIPDPDFILSFTIRAFRSKITQESTATTGIYRVLATVKIENADKNFNKVYIDERIFDTIFIRIPAGNSAQIEVWQQYQKSLAQLITGMAKAFNKVDSKWLEDSVANGQNAKDAFTTTSQLFKSLR